MLDVGSPAVIALLCGLAVGGVVGCVAAGRVSRRMARSSPAPKTVTWMAVSALVIGAIPSALSAFILGGNLGLTLNTFAGNTATGEALWMGMCIGAVLALGLALSAALGAWLGVAVAGKLSSGYAAAALPARHHTNDAAVGA